jgi:hypothetical protein
MSRRIWFAVAASVVVSSACGSGSPGSPSSTLTPVSASSLRGAIVSAVDGHPLTGVTVKVGSQSAVSDASGAFQLNNVPSGTQSAVLSGSSVVERRTTVAVPDENVVEEPLIPADFDLTSFDQMFRATGRLERWISPPSLVVITTVMNYENGFGDNTEYHATSEQLTDAETSLLVSQLTDALGLLTGDSFTTFASVQLESEASGSVVNTLRPGKIVVGRYRGIQGFLNTIGFGRWAADDTGRVTAGAVYLDRDFDKASDQRRLLRTHELGHALGYNHVTARTSIMNPMIGPEPTTFDRQAATVAFQRQPGNQSPDTDSTAPAGGTAPGGLFTASPIAPSRVRSVF